MMTQDEIIADLLKKIDSLQQTINHQNSFIMRMATYRDEREDKISKEQTECIDKFLDMARDTNLIEQIFRWIYHDGSARRADFHAGRPAEERDDLDS